MTPNTKMCANNWKLTYLDGPTKKLPIRYADERNFYKAEKWTKDGQKVDRLLYAGNNLDKARDIFAEARAFN